MTKRFLIENSDYDLKYEMRIADLTRVDKTKEDFFNEEEECYDYNKFLEYLYDNNAFLTKDEAEKVLNEQDQKLKELEQELFAEKVQRLDERLEEYGGPDDEKVWQEEFGMSQREAKKKAGWSNWCYYPE